MSLSERLLSKYTISDSGCWEYTGGLNGRGYGNIWDNGTTRSAHVVSYELHCGPVPEGLNVLHSCDNRKCICPDHLFVGTTQNNIDDMVNKGRDGFKGSRNGRALLTENDILAIRRLLNCYSQQYIADKYGVSRSTIAAIKSGRNWGVA